MIAPSDAAVALRSLPRRFRQVLVRGEDDEMDRPDHLVRRAGDDGWSALDHAAHVAASLAALHAAMHDALIRDERPLDPSVLDDAARGPGPGGAGARSVSDVLSALEHEATSFADEVERAPAAAWARAGALEALQEAVDSSVAHLRAGERIIDAQRGR
jgi:hypothetical protein